MNKLSILAVVAALVALFAVNVHASAITGSQGFTTPLLAEADASPTGDINTADMFTLENLVTTINSSGIFAGLPPQSFGTVNFDTGLNTSFRISDTEFGKFDSTKIFIVSNTPGFLNILLKGNWTPGAFEAGHGFGTSPATFRMSFTQSPEVTGEISFSGTMNTTAVIVPEPPTWLLMLGGIGLGLVLAGAKLRGAFRT